MNTTTAPIIHLSKKGMKELKKSISNLEKELERTSRELRELDRSDSHDERLARVEKLREMEVIESDLADKREYIQRAKLLPRKRDALRVAIGSVVELVDQHGRLLRYTIVDSLEANPSDGRISILSPLGQNLIGKSVQQTIEWTTAKLHTTQ